MKAWIDEKVRRLVVAGAVAFAVGAPTIACMGGDVSDGATDATDAAGDDDDDDDDDDASAADRLQGEWRYFPVEEELRTLKIINAAISGRKKVIEKLKPLSADEQATYQEFSKLPKDDPMAQAMAEMIKVMKGATVEFDGDTFALKTDEGTSESGYSITSESGDSVTVVVDMGPTGEKETHDMTFVSDSKIDDEVETASGAKFSFELKRK